MRTRRWCAPAFALGLAASPLAGQADSTASRPDPVDSDRFEIVVDSSAATVGFAIRIPGGSAADPTGMEGTAAVLTTALNDVVAQQASSLPAEVRLVLDRGGVTVRGRTAPDAIAPVLDLVRRVAFETPPALVHLEQIRAQLLARLRFEAGAPVRAFEDHSTRIVFAGVPGWSHPISGTLASVEAIELDDLAGKVPFDAATRRGVTAAVVGPVEPIAIAETLWSLVGETPAQRTPAAGRIAWTQGAVEEIQAEITSTWVAVGLPIESRIPPWKVELLAHHIAEVLQSDPPRPGIVSPKVEIHYPRGMPVILVSFAITPERAQAWVDRILSTARLESDAPPDERFFRWQRRRFRTVWLSERASPEARADLRVQGWTGATPTDMEGPFDVGVWRTDLEDASRALGEPRIVMYGPVLNGSETQHSPDLHGSGVLDPN